MPASVQRYFDAMRIPLRAGRFFTQADSEQASSVAIVSESTGRRLWPNQNPIGKRISIASSVTANGVYPTQAIVGVVPDIPDRGITERHLDIYMPATQTQNRVAYLVVRTTGNPAALARSVSIAVRDVAPRTIVERVRTLDALVADAFAPIRFTMALLVALAVIGTVVAAGLYALTAYSVSQSTPDLALRMAMGASSGMIVRMTMWQTGKFGVAGLVFGSFVSAALVKSISPLLFEVPALDLLAFAATASLLGAVVCLAPTWRPAV